MEVAHFWTAAVGAVFGLLHLAVLPLVGFSFWFVRLAVDPTRSGLSLDILFGAKGESGHLSLVGVA